MHCENYYKEEIMEDNKFHIIITALLIAGIVIIILGCAAMYHYKVILMAERGFQEVSYPGSTTSYFQKI